MFGKVSAKASPNGNKNIKKLYSGKTNWLNVVLFAVAIVLVLGATYGIILMTEHRTHSSAEKLVSDVVKRIDNKMLEVEEATRNEAVTVKSRLDDPEALEKLIYDFVNDNDFIYGSTIAFEPNAFPDRGYSFAPYSWHDDNGVHSRQLGEETDFYLEEWYAETKKIMCDYWCEPYFDEGGAKIMMCTFSVPLIDENGQLIAILTSDVGLEDLEEYITSIIPTSESFILLRSKKGTALVNADMETSADIDHVIIKGMTNIGWSVELSMPFAYLMRGDTGMAFAIGIILFATVLLVYFINLLIIKSQQRASAKYQHVIDEQSAFTEFFLEPYISAYYVGLDDLSVQIYKRTSNLEKEYPITANYIDSLKEYIEKEVHPDDKKDFLDIIRPEKTKEMLAENPDFSYTFRTVADGIRYIRFQVIRGADEGHAAFGFVDMTDQVEEQQKRLLGAMPLSNDVLAKANIGMWAFELDEGQPPRMYDDETMLGLVGLDHQVPPEEAYHAWYDHIDEDSYDLVTDAVNKMISGEHAEVQYPWHFPDGHTIVVRCGGIRNYDYTKGIRIEGTHQDVTQTLHYDEEERKRAKQIENDLLMEKLRADSLAFISDNEPDLDNAISFFGNRILEISGCDQVVYREIDGRKIVLNAPGSEEISEEICSECPFAQFGCAAFDKDGTVLMNDCRLGYEGLNVPAGCPAKSSFMQLVYSGGKVVGKLTVHYLNDFHAFTENGIGLMKTVAVYLGIMIGRIKEKQAEIARIEAESSNKAKTEFLFNMSHDIRTPMNAILGYTDIAIRHANSPAKVDDSLKKIKVAGGHLLNLINDILEMSRIEAGKLELVNVPLDIIEAINGIDHMSQALAVPKSIDYSTEIGTIRNQYIFADELHINQILINLISNAIKYTSPGGVVKYQAEQISVPVNGVARYRFTIKDTGIGMSEEFQKHLFENFSRENSATVSKQEGAGLGLAIVKRISDLAGGTIDVQSEKDRGSTFVIELPFRVMNEAEIEEFKATKADDVIIEETGTFDGKKLLLAEDNELNRGIATEILTEAGFVVDTAEDGAIAVNIITEKGIGYYDFVLMDIQMPVMNGYDATAEIRKLPGGDKLPIIALSANAFIEDKQKSLDVGMNDHVAKPINIKELLGVLTKYLK